MGAKGMEILVGTYGAGVWSLRTETWRAAPLLDAQDPSWLLRAGSDRLYLAEERLGSTVGSVACFQRSGAGWQATAQVSTGGENPCHLARSADGRWLAAANYTSGSVAVFALDEAGTPAERQLLAGHHGGVHPQRQEGPHAHFVSFQPEGLWCCDLGADEIRRYVLSGTAWQEVSPLRLPPGTGPRHLLRRGERLYVLCELTGELLSCRVQDGAVTARQALAPGRSGTGAALRMDNAGRLWTSHRGGDCVCVYAPQPDGSLKLVTRADCGGRCPRDVLPLPDGALCACQESGEVTRLVWSGTELQLAARLSLPTPVGLCFA